MRHYSEWHYEVEEVGLFFYTFLCCKSTVLPLSSDTTVVKYLKQEVLIARDISTAHVHVLSPEVVYP